MSRPVREPPPDLLTDRDQEAEPVEVAKQIILKQLSHSPKTRHQLTQTLAKRDVPDGAARSALDRITELGYIDDAAFARVWIESRHHAKGLSRSVLRRELTARGISPDLIDTSLAELVDGESERAAARSLVDRKLRTMSAVPPDVATRRMVAMLGRKGYPSGLAFTVVRDALQRASGE